MLHFVIFPQIVVVGVSVLRAERGRFACQHVLVNPLNSLTGVRDIDCYRLAAVGLVAGEVCRGGSLLTVYG